MAKVFWTDDERIQMVQRAVDLQAAGAGITGLALLREAIKVLPEKRQRRVIALSQAPWFQRMVSDETRHRALDSRAQVTDIRAWQRNVKDSLSAVVLLLQTLVGEVQTLNEKVDDVAPSISRDEGNGNRRR